MKHRVTNYMVRPLWVTELVMLTGLYDYNDVDAIHMYQSMGFTEVIARKYEEYQGDGYEYNLYLRREVHANRLRG